MLGAVETDGDCWPEYFGAASWSEKMRCLEGQDLACLILGFAYFGD